VRDSYGPDIDSGELPCTGLPCLEKCTGTGRGFEVLGSMPRQTLWSKLLGMGSAGTESKMAPSQQQQLQKMWPGEQMESKTHRCAELKQFCSAKLS